MPESCHGVAEDAAMHAARLVLLGAAVGLAVVAVPNVGADGGAFTITARKRTEKGEAVEFTRPLDPKKTAIVVCDMWDDHWCQSAAKRCAVLAKQAEPVVAAARAKGVTIVHAPSDCMTFYADHPARTRTLAVKKAEPPKPKDLPDPPLPIDDSDGGCDDVPPAKFSKAWTRQHPAITIDPKTDYISDNGVEVYAILKEKGLTTLVVMGVHTNMCVLKRTFAIKQMARWGLDVLLVRDLTDAMYNPKMKPFVPHDRGTGLVVEYIEANWCPTIEARHLGGK